MCIGPYRQGEDGNMGKIKQLSKQISHCVIRAEYKVEAKCLLSVFVVID